MFFRNLNGKKKKLKTFLIGGYLLNKILLEEVLAKPTEVTSVKIKPNKQMQL